MSSSHLIITAFEKYGFLIKENNTIFTSLDNIGKISKVEENDIIQALLHKDILKFVTEFHTLDNSLFYFISFKDSDACKLFKSEIKCIQDKEIIFHSVPSVSKVVTLKVLWTPLLIILKSFKSVLAKIGTIKKITPTYRILENSIKIISSPIIIEMELNSNIAYDDIPRLLVNQYGLKSWIMVEGRPRLCFSCMEAGHVFKSCPNKFCGKCGIGMPNGHICRLSDYVLKYIYPGESAQIKTSEKTTQADKQDYSSNQASKISKQVDTVSVKKNRDVVQASTSEEFFDTPTDYEHISTHMDYKMMDYQEGYELEDLDEIRRLIEKEYDIKPKSEDIDQNSVSVTSRKRKGKHK